ncbi:MAG: hypothetical protein A2Y66_06305 [Nitrospirae bacterium RBG_13_41_22]|nr:MAG: hypothetical protein A2Y66_06305 [Nitrospirae bacterium RBG_13_41_22]
MKKFIFRYLNVPLTDDIWNILMTKTNRNIINKIIELKKFLNNVCIIRVNSFALIVKIEIIRNARNDKGHAESVRGG